MYQNRASGYKIDIEEANSHCWRNDCNSVLFAKQQPTSLWDLKNDDTYKKRKLLLHFVAEYK